MKEIAAVQGFSAAKPLLVRLQPAFFEFPILHDGPDFIATFGRILEFRKDLRKLAATVTYALDKKYKLGLDPDRAGVPAPKKYYGAHLRTDVDAIAASFASYEEQSSAYLKGAKEHNLPFIYLASGSAADIARFTKDAKAKSIKVTTKTALLADEEFKSEKEELEKMTWDQQALVDFEMLLRSSHFGGTWASSFAYNIAFQRHVAVCEGGWSHSRDALAAKRRKRGLVEVEVEERGKEKEAERKLNEGEDYKDSVSTIYGPPAMGIWFELSMWP